MLAARRVDLGSPRESTIPSNVFAITFDDGFENNFVHAWPVLKELNIQATISLATNTSIPSGHFRSMTGQPRVRTAVPATRGDRCRHGSVKSCSLTG